MLIAIPAGTDLRSSPEHYDAKTERMVEDFRARYAKIDAAYGDRAAATIRNICAIWRPALVKDDMPGVSALNEKLAGVKL